MTRKSYLMGIDISTSTAKAILIDTQGNVLGVGSTSLSIQTPRPLWVEQDPREWWNGVADSIRQVLKQTGVEGSQIEAIGLTGQMHGLVLLDGEGQVLRPSILWNDNRTAAQCDEIREKVGFHRFIQISGNNALTGFTAPKLLWVKENEPDVFAKTRHMLLPKDYIRYRLTGAYGMDKADGSGTILFNLRERNWSQETLDILGIPAEILPETFEGPQFTGKVSAEAAAETGLMAGIPVAAGGGDQSCQATGVGAVRVGVVGLTVGTSGVVFATTPSALIEPEGRLQAFCHAIPGMWHYMGVVNSAAGSLQWYRDTLAPGVSYDDLVKEAEDAPPGCEGLQFTPYLTGERTPYPDPFARGAFIGLTLRHNRGYMTRAVLEGVAFALKDVFQLIKNAGLGEIEQVRASGGGTKGALWRQILADVLDQELAETNTTEGAGFGCALLAGVGAGIWPDAPTASEQTIQITRRTSPNPKNVEAYKKPYELYQTLYPTLKSTFARMAE